MNLLNFRNFHKKIIYFLTSPSGKAGGRGQNDYTLSDRRLSVAYFLFLLNFHE